LRDLLISGSGSATSVGVDVLAFIESQLRLDKSSHFHNTPDFQLMFMTSWILADYWTFIWKSFGLDGDRLWENYFKDLYFPKNMDAVSILPLVLRPKSRGEITLSSSNPWAPPNINPRYFDDPDDLKLLVTAVEKTLDMVNKSSHLLQHGFQLPQQHWPGCEKHILFSTNYWTCYVKEMSLTVYHPVGTCKMSPDSSGVLDHHLRVKGVPGLRVADASIMPNIVSGNTNAATVAIAEKAADLVKQEWLNSGGGQEKEERSKTGHRRKEEL